MRTERPDRFGFFATLPMPDIQASVAEAERALDERGGDGVVLLANNRGVYLGTGGQDPLFRALEDRVAVVFIHPAELPGPAVDGIVPFAADFLLDTTRAAYLLVRNRVVSRYPNIRFILSHAGGFVPYASHRMSVAIAAETGRTPLEALEDFQSFYFDTALSSSPAALPTLLAFARPGHILFGSDWPFAPTQAARYFANGLDQHNLDPQTRAAINRHNAARLFKPSARRGTADARPDHARTRRPPGGSARHRPSSLQSRTTELRRFGHLRAGNRSGLRSPPLRGREARRTSSRADADRAREFALTQRQPTGANTTPLWFAYAKRQRADRTSRLEVNVARGATRAAPTRRPPRGTPCG
jgi:predicted TIM-barrel fold metal-dependent hydrolase